MPAALNPADIPALPLLGIAWCCAVAVVLAVRAVRGGR